jgi:2',3'-cyclic-nucleotide 2'-phosphodiesterase (5'-nucleotidase family)
LQKLHNLVILHTNDIHSHFEQMPRIAGLLARERALAAHTLTIDCGDHMDRAFVETEGSMGLANIAVLNACGYDLVIPGNNEGLTLSSASLARAYHEADFDVVCANLLDSSTGLAPDWMIPSRILTCGSVRVGFIGVTVAYTDFYKLLGWEARDPFETVSRLVDSLRSEVDVLVVLSHLGLSTDRQLAASVPGIDIILGGHTHQLLEQPLRENGTLICMAGKFGTHVGRVDIAFDPQTGTIHTLEACCLPTADVEPCAAITSLVAKHREDSLLVLSRPLFRLAEPLTIRWETESPFGNLLAAGIRRHTGAEIGLVNAGQVLESLTAGDVTLARLHEICPSPINCCLCLLEGRELLAALEAALLPEYTLKPIYGYGFRGKLLGTLCLDGLTIEYEPQAEPYHRIKRIRVGDEPLDPARVYRVGTIDMFRFGLGYPTLATGETVRFYLPYFLRELLADELQHLDAALTASPDHWIPLTKPLAE